ncbi:M10 family metallopeptidase C-terminal domain-containing protein [Paracoccus alkanivorans]|uniref:Peptidase n=1 Tax=Paracoccus alkanivorans TaxID=2116655 RepID=A0A3M0M932_9RHOB|nr:M10 family metallopeptidase C-terminal domain-containing protein [Paracoccus alkanivorans]RMC32080.1 peptidase [Paracoccus alkanivorans]
MCNICANVRPFDSQCSYKDLSGTSTGDVLQATITETGDAPANTSTTYRIAPGDTFQGSVADGGDDWIAVSLEAGKTFDISLTGRTLQDPYLELRDASGRLIASNDDSGGELNSQIVFTPNSTGTYYINATSFGSGSGSYQLAVDEVRPASMGELADYLINGFWEDNGSAARSFDVSGDNIITVNLNGLTTQGRQLARAAMEAWSAVGDLEFRESSGAADITFDDEYSGAYATATTTGRYTSSAEINISTEWLDTYGTRIGTYSFQTYVHELGHALGLGHQGNYNGNATYGVDETFVNDSWQASIMSYFSQTDNTTINASYALLGTIMPADIIAIQRLYGAADQSSLTAGRTVYGINHTLGNSWLGQIFTAQSGGNAAMVQNARNIALTIHDAGGYDVLDFSNDTESQYIDLMGRAASSIYGLDGNLQFARATVIEEYRAGSGADAILGNDANNRLFGNDGADLINGGIGNDSIRGGDQYDTIYGGSGNDTVWGGYGRDVIRLQDGNDIFHDDGQNDWNGYDNAAGGNGNDTLNGGGGNDTLHGDNDADLINGGIGNDSIRGGSQYDTIYGGSGNDTVWGGYGRDVIRLQDGNDIFHDDGQNDWNGYDNVAGGNGNDTLNGGGGNDMLHGDNDADLINGGIGNDSIRGGSQYDTIYGGSGNDTVWGGYGRDVIRLQDGNDIFHDDGQNDWNGYDNAAGGNGNDTLNGGGGNDTLHGDNGADLITGGIGNDRLTGGLGADLLNGGSGADIFVFNNIAHTSPGADTRDIIRDFSTDTDRIDLSDIDANTTVNGNQAFRFLADNPHSGGGATLRFAHSSTGNTHIYGDVDADGRSDFEIMLTGRHSLTADDFIL